MKVLVCGSRSWSDEDVVYERLRQLPREAQIIHGGARGADRLAGAAAQALGLHVTEFPADWETHGKRAGILRNLDMLAKQPDLVIAFWQDGSSGTAHTISEAKRRGIPVEVFRASWRQQRCLGRSR